MYKWVTWGYLISGNLQWKVQAAWLLAAQCATATGSPCEEVGSGSVAFQIVPAQDPLNGAILWKQNNILS